MASAQDGLRGGYSRDGAPREILRSGGALGDGITERTRKRQGVPEVPSLALCVGHKPCHASDGRCRESAIKTSDP
jgi:hypothetical protein